MTKKDANSFTLGRVIWPRLEDGLKEKQKQGYAASQARTPGPETRVATVRKKRQLPDTL